jgi:hypothetical protein
MLAEAVTLYLETCFASNSPCLRPVPAEEDPRRDPPENLVEIFPVEVTCRIYPLNWTEPTHLDSARSRRQT